MRFEERIRADVPPAEAWAFLWRTERLAACLPGCTAVREVDPGRRYEVRFEDRVGPYKVRFDMAVAVEETREGEYVRLRGAGQDKALGASQRVVLAVTLEPAGEGATVLAVDADVEVLGKIATLGQFVIKRKAQDVVTRFAENIRLELSTRAGAPPA